MKEELATRADSSRTRVRYHAPAQDHPSCPLIDRKAQVHTTAPTLTPPSLAPASPGTLPQFRVPHPPSLQISQASTLSGPPGLTLLQHQPQVQTLTLLGPWCSLGGQPSAWRPLNREIAHLPSVPGPGHTPPGTPGELLQTLLLAAVGREGRTSVPRPLEPLSGKGACLQLRGFLSLCAVLFSPSWQHV